MLFAFPHQPDAPNPLYLQCHRKQLNTIFHSISVGFMWDIEPFTLRNLDIWIRLLLEET